MANKPVTKAEELRIYRGLTLSANSLPTPEEQRKHLDRIPPPPPWRSFSLSPEEWTKAAKSQEIPPEQGKIDPRALGFVADKKAVELVNAALCLRRPLLIEVDNRLKVIENGQAEMKADVKTVQKDTTDLKIELTEVKGDIKTLDSKFDDMNKRLEKVEGTQKNQIWTLITVLSGSLLAVGFRSFFIDNNP